MARNNQWTVLAIMSMISIVLLLLFNIGGMKQPNFEVLMQSTVKEFQKVSQQFSKIKNEITKEGDNWYRPSWYDLRAEDMSPQESIDYFLWSNHTSCDLMNDYGGRFMGPSKNKAGELFHLHPRGYDGQKSVCLLPDSVAPQSGSCLVYSFGINYDWSFDEVMEKYGCEVFAFDPSMEDMEDKADHSSKIHFYKIGLAPNNTKNDKGWKMMDFESIRQMLGHKDRIVDYLKIDVEYDEWQILPQLMKSGALNHVRQMGVEVGFLLPLSTSWKTYQDMVVILRKMERHYGMVRFDSKRNPFYAAHFPFVNKYTSLAYEIAWYNSKFLN